MTATQCTWILTDATLPADERAGASAVAVDAAGLDVPYIQSDPVGPRTVPFLVAGLLLACAVALAVDVLRSGRGEAEALLRAGDTTVGGRLPVNPSGGLACFGEAVPAQALAQVCELTWQLRGQAAGRQVEGARVGITATQGLFGHGSAVVLTR